ncbi:hypothetical protein [Pontibacter mangrovi]|uniref:Uncharacterized protein n=1 Tax=Pontibacter mangrovi TaxID=2589816 RepID=A0A501W2F4_9BACT|nr:hypothetical protein [Pontibacter mangrovi]TPE42460.1 hypothetical protein FJM65_17795 [Pontibacter mangrovi]
MIEKLQEEDASNRPEKLQAAYEKLRSLLSELSARNIPADTEAGVNALVREVNTSAESGDALAKQVEEAYKGVLKLVEKELQLVPRNYHRNLWMALGMAAFGLPLGMLFATALGNYGLMGIGLPIGLAMGLGVGTSLDKKAAAEGRQLSVE